MNIKGALRISLRASKKRGVHNGAGNYCDKCKGGKSLIGIYHAEYDRPMCRWGPTLQIQTAMVPCRVCHFISFDDAWYAIRHQLATQFPGDYHSLTYGEPDMVLT